MYLANFVQDWPSKQLAKSWLHLVDVYCFTLYIACNSVATGKNPESLDEGDLSRCEMKEAD